MISMIRDVNPERMNNINNNATPSKFKVIGAIGRTIIEDKV
jgi:hypothetical protein